MLPFGLHQQQDGLVPCISLSEHVALDTIGVPVELAIFLFIRTLVSKRALTMWKYSCF